jgi:TRAP-type mannitol/chloroaromatic compound transport system permease small subunit
MVLLCCIVSAGNAVVRKIFSYSSNSWLEIQWYMFGAMVLLGAAHTLNKNEHVRIDILYGNLSSRAQMWIDLVGAALFLLPVCVIIGWVSWPLFMNSYAINEMSSNSGGLLRWPVKLLLPLGFLLLTLQGIRDQSNIGGLWAIRTGHRYEKPLQ